MVSRKVGQHRLVVWDGPACQPVNNGPLPQVDEQGALCLINEA
jgi:hypothetical protein